MVYVWINITSCDTRCMCALHVAVAVNPCRVCCHSLYVLLVVSDIIFTCVKCVFCQRSSAFFCSHPWEIDLWYFGQQAEEELKQHCLSWKLQLGLPSWHLVLSVQRSLLH